MGVVYVRLPLPLNEKMLLWFAKGEYTKANEDGKTIGQWTDELGREWFEAENNKYHVRGYAMCAGSTPGWCTSAPRPASRADMAELGLAARCVQTFIPDPHRPTRVQELNDDDGATVASGKPGAE